jgi:hypothetical protein
MSFPVSFPRNLPTRHVSVLNDDFLSLDGFLDGAPTENYQVAIILASPWPPLAVTWLANPGPKTPTTVGRYVVAMRFVSSTTPVIYVGFLIVS